jgi:hypothetical protein
VVGAKSGLQLLFDFGGHPFVVVVEKGNPVPFGGLCARIPGAGSSLTPSE